jgi:hypothetical protein
MSRIGPCQGTPAFPIGFEPTFVPWWTTTTWTLTPSFRSRSGSALIRGASSRKDRPAVAPAETSSGVFSSSAPITPTGTPLMLKTFDGVTHGGALPVDVSTMRAAPPPASRRRGS